MISNIMIKKLKDKNEIETSTIVDGINQNGIRHTVTKELNFMPLFEVPLKIKYNFKCKCSTSELMRDFFVKLSYK